MTFETIKETLKWPTLLVGAFIGIRLIMGAFGWEINSTDEKLHVELTQHVEKTEPKIDIISVEQMAINDAIKSLSAGVDAALTGECLENSFEALVRQRLIQKCKELGVDRTMYRTPDQAQSAPMQPTTSDTLES